MKTFKNHILVFVLTLFTTSLTYSAFAQAPSDKFVVVVDAGHGGKDPGKPTKNNYKESDIALKIALILGKELEKYDGFEIIYTRKTDIFLELHERAAIANKADADLFVSIHCNAHHTQAYGTETYVLGSKNSERNMSIARAENEVIFLEDNYEKNYAGFDPHSPETSIAIGIEQEVYVEQSIVLAQKIENNFGKKLKRRSRGIKQLSLWVLHNTYMPSVLIETGFITNKKEGAFLNSKAGQSKIANGIKDAIIIYKSELDQNIGESLFVSSSETLNNNEDKESSTNVIFKIQIAASSRELETKPYNFKGLADISREKQNNIYKYFYGNTSNYIEAKTLKNAAKSKGYSSCFIVAYKNGKKISVQEALKRP
ncbi:MAG: N-acetylmuramoyl-L-alanine amidase [Winogradskyella sp.]|uniref:N-acetylmuramoyl-L-alanine amidase family protein n=1 Tax=Winogradskyella sp. TaxID=1883156 RepID=UPI0018381D53|nr:N-acetylmuramoyl-L-alanine amidase [Winogradskyella sp.]MBT8245926.1 N-acetylmuramoyl-L-alanine amidase [Winogradskyella sp.]NNK23700.1 N-acetylmuramoyl-L-alanine amidase [Winogradskyella sp.]